MGATLIETPTTTPEESQYTRVPTLNGVPFTAAHCEGTGGHEVPVREWPPRKRHPHRPPSTSGVCKRCECNVAVPCPLTDVIKVILPDGTVLDAKSETKKR